MIWIAATSNPWSPFPCFFLISLPVSFSDFPCFSGRVAPKILLGQDSKTPKKPLQGKSQKENRKRKKSKEIPQKNKEKNRDQGLIASRLDCKKLPKRPFQNCLLNHRRRIGKTQQHMKRQQPRTTTLECSNSTSWGPKAVTAVKWRLLHPAIIERQQLHSQLPPN